MKHKLLLIIPLFFILNLSANPLLIDLNREWLNQEDINVHDIKNVPTHEVGKIKMHLRLVEQTLRNRKTSHLSKTQKLNRVKCLDILSEYWQLGVFPQNENYAYRTPIFIDKYNTFCAVGHLMKRTGAENIARRISESNNLVYVRDISNQKAADWMLANGLSMEECAWIQPGYGGSPIEFPIDLSGLSTANPIVNRQIAGTSPAATFSAHVTSSSGLTNPVTDSLGNILLQLGVGSTQCITITFQGGNGVFLLNAKGSRNALGGTLDQNDSITTNWSFGNSSSYFQSNYYTYLNGYIPITDISSDTNWYLQIIPDSTNSNQFTLCASRSSSSSATNNSLPMNLAMLDNSAVQLEYNEFSLKKYEQDILIYWSTISEFNNEYFTIEKSIDTSKWESIGQVWSKGNSSNETSYSFTDSKPAFGTNWYRIKSTDFDGKEQYSKIQSIRLAKVNNGIEVLSANPVMKNILLRAQEMEYLDNLFITNTVGQKMSFDKRVIADQLEINVSHFPSGIYFIKSDRFNYTFIK